MSEKLPRATGKDIVAALQRSGWQPMNQRGSHVKLHRPGMPGRVIVATHAGRILPPGTLKSILQQAGMTNRFTVVLTPEPDGSAYNVTVPALPGCLTWGDTVEEALMHAREAIALYLEDEDDVAGLIAANDSIVATVTV